MRLKRLISKLMIMSVLCTAIIPMTATAKEEDNESLNILFIGNDQREDENARSDSMILVSVDMEDYSVDMISFMRDMYLPIEGYKDNRLNASYSIGGKDLLKQTIEKNFPTVHIDNVVEVDFSGFESVIDVVGGVDVELNEEEIIYMNQNSQSEGYEALSEAPGAHHMDGKQALAYSRIRYIGNGDFERTERQRKVLSSLVVKAKDLSFMELIQLYRKGIRYVDTDLSYAQILSFALHARDFSKESICTYNIPQDAAYKDGVKRGMMVLLPDIEKCNELLESVLEENDTES